MTETVAAGRDYPEAAARAREQRGWYWYDWANSAYVTTTATVLIGPYLTAVAKTAACGTSDGDCATTLSVLGVAVAPGSLVFYVVTVSTIISALVLPVVGAIADRSARKRVLLAGFAWTGAVFATGLGLVSGGNWSLGVLCLVVANICLGASLVVYDALLIEIATPDERDRVSSRGWAFGYVGGAALLVVNLIIVSVPGTFGLDKSTAVRISLASAGLWWAGFTVIPFLRLRDREPLAKERLPGGLVRTSFGQLADTLRDLRRYPQTLLFLVAYLFFNDGIQTVIYASSTYGNQQLGFGEEVLVAAILLVQVVAIAGALLLGRLARTYGAYRVVLYSLLAWTAVIVFGFFLPARALLLFLLLAALIGLVLGGTQALSRSLYSQLVPRGREAEYFSLYQACERGTSWLGTLAFGLTYQLTGSYRWAIVMLALFFVVGGLLLRRVDVRRGIVDAGNPVPAVI